MRKIIKQELLDKYNLKFVEHSNISNTDYYETQDGYILKINRIKFDSNEKLTSPLKVENKFAIQNIKLFLKSNNIAIEIVSEKMLPSKQNMKWKCLVCNHEWGAVLDNIRNKKSGCPKCGTKRQSDKQRRSVSDVNDLIKSKDLKWIEGEYKNAYSQIYCLTKDNYIVPIIYRNLKKRDDVELSIFQNHKYTLQNIRRFMDEHHPDLELVSTEYERAIAKLNVKCNLDGYEYEVAWDKLKQGRSCPLCMSSQPEKDIYLRLRNEGLHLIKEHKFEDCTNKNELRFDFYLPAHNICIEYDGRQHFEPMEFYGGEEGYEYNKLRDSIKDEYCERNGIKLVRIPYFADLNYELNKLIDEIKGVI